MYRVKPLKYIRGHLRWRYLCTGIDLILCIQASVGFLLDFA